MAFSQHLRGHRRFLFPFWFPQGGSYSARTSAFLLLSSAYLQPLHLPRLPRRMSTQCYLQTQGGRYRAFGPETLPGLPQMCRAMPLQKGDVSRNHRYIRKMHRLLSPGGTRIGAALRGGLRRKNPTGWLGNRSGKPPSQFSTEIGRGTVWT